MSIQRIDPIAAFAEYALIADTPSEIDFYLRQTLILNEPFIEYRECIVYHQGDLGEFLRSNNQPSYTITCVNPRIPAFQIRQEGEKDGVQNSGTIVVLESTNRNLFRVVTVSKGQFWNYTVKPLLRKSYPQISTVYFKQNELEIALSNFEKKLILRFSGKIKLSVVDITRKTELLLDQSRKSKFISTDRSWTNYSLAETFSELQERGSWFTSLKFRISRIAQSKEAYFTRAIGKVSKFGFISCSAMYDELRSFLVEPLEQLAAERMHLLEGRGIIEREYKPGPPLEIVYDNNVFDSPSVVRQFGEILGHYRDASIVVYHANPYFHASIADQQDGSSFEIWVLSQHRILVSPQAKASAQALSRIVTYIFDRFKEGTISEYAPENK